MPKKSRLWCFTNYDLDFDYNKYMEETTAVYLAYGEETCPTTGREHHQGWVYFEQARGSIKGVAAQFATNKEAGMQGKVLMCKGNIDTNADYCAKEGKLHEFGVKPKPGRRVDLDTLKASIMDGTASVDEIAVEHPAAVHQYGRTLDRLEDIALRKRFRTWQTEGTWVFGPTGVGKSHYAFEGFNPETHYVHNLNDGGWWDNYTHRS